MALRPDDWLRVRQVFEHALTLPAEQRQPFVADALGEAELRQRAESLIEAHVRAEHFLEIPATAAFHDRAIATDLSGTQLGPYELQARVGAGGMGDVYRARDSRLERIVAVKVLTAYATGDEPVRKQFEREARAVAALNHPNICTLHDVGATGAPADAPLHYLVMEFLDGETLANVLARGPVPVAVALDYAIQIGSALRVAHAAGIIHRDLKPANIMVTDTGAKLLDFGLAKRPGLVLPSLQAPAGTWAAGVTLSAFGTLCYMAPEQLRREPADARTDVYAFRCLLYEMLTGARLFADRAATGVVQPDALDRPRLDHALLPADIQDILAGCLAPAPGDRWQTADALVERLKRAAATHAGIDASRRTSTRSRRRALAMAAVVVVLGAGVWTFGGRPSTPPAQLAVLPLRAIGGIPPGDEHLGIAIADSIITRLAIVRLIGLRPTTAVMGYADQQTDPVKVAAELAVDYLLTGTIQRGSSTYRVTFQLVRSPGGEVTWGRTYDVVRSGLRDVQDSVAEQVVGALRLELGSNERDRLRRRYTDRADAYEHYMRGRASLLNYTEAGMKGAIAAFEQAVAIDPGYALARAGLAMARAWFSIRYAYETDALKWGERAEADARAALASDPDLAEARLAIAGAAGTLHGGFNWPAVIDEASRALEIDPTLELAHVVRMRAYFHFGLFDRMVTEAEAARRMNPLGNVEVARLEVAGSLFSGQYQRARDLAAALLARSDAPVIRNYLGLAQFYAGDPDGARSTLAAVRRAGRPDVRSQAALASVEAAAGDRESARVRALNIERGPYMDHHVAYSLAAAWAQLGDASAAIKWLRASADTGFPCFPAVQRDPLLNPIRQSREFRTFLALQQQRYERDTTRYGLVQ
jgi:serine/threonine protein kinase/tetratricopeptide (TPR) repeat protein